MNELQELLVTCPRRTGFDLFHIKNRDEGRQSVLKSGGGADSEVRKSGVYFDFFKFRDTESVFPGFKGSLKIIYTIKFVI